MWAEEWEQNCTVKVICQDYSMGNLNEDNTSWYYEDKTLSGHIYKGFMLNPVTGYSEYDKEMLKRTMLQHEAIFRKQVYELHRLYRIQKNLMDDLKMKELYSLSGPKDTSRSDLFSSQLSSEVTEKTWQMLHLTTGNETRPPLNFLKENSVSSTPSINGAFLKDGEFLDSNFTKFPRKMFDLQLPADVYINNEDAEIIEKENVSKTFLRATVPVNTVHGLEPEIDVKPTPSLGEDRIWRKDGWKSDSHPENGMPIHKVNDLNDPIKDIFCEGEAGSDAAEFCSVKTHHEGMQEPQLLRDFFTDLHKDKEETRQELPLFYNEVGNRRDHQSPKLDLFKPPMMSKPIEATLSRAHEIGLPDQNKTNSTYSGPTVQTRSPFQVLPHCDYSSATSPLASSWRKPIKNITHVPIAVQALPCFNRSSATNLQSKLGLRSNSNSSMHLQLPPISFPIRDLDSHGDKSIYGTPDGCRPQKCFRSLQCADIKPAIDVGLNQELTNGTRDVGWNHEEVSRGISWLGMKPSCTVSVDTKECASPVESSVSRDYRHLISTHDNQKIKKQERGKGPSLWAPQDLPSSSFAEESRIPRNEVSDGLNVKRILGFPILDKAESSTSTNDTSCSDSLHHNRFSHDFKLDSAVKGVGRNHVNLNSVVSCSNAPNSSENSPEEVAPEIGMETKCSHETLVSVAAENLVAMSFAVRSHSADLIHPTSCDSLRWFAEVVSSRGGVESPDTDDGLDYFESMTLKLETMKADEYWCRPLDGETGSQKDEGTGTASLLLTMSRRGQGRKRRQRRDFQKDILPGLASLSRNEVTEDLKAIGGLMRASIRASRSRGRLRPRSLVVTVAEIRVDSNSSQPTRTESELDGRTVARWGRRTRRCRRPRVPSGNVSALLS